MSSPTVPTGPTVPTVPAAAPVLAEVERSGFVESRHRGAAVALEPNGDPVLALGDVRAPMFPRSSNKPMQAVGMLRAGLDLDGELLALASASHSGEAFHLEGVRRILDRAGLGVDALQTPPDLPVDEQEREAALARGDVASSLYMNCSGKHAAMLLTAVRAGADPGTYRSIDNAVQVSIRDALEDLSGEPVTAIGVDGCGAPLMAISTLGLARAFSRIATAADDTPEGRVARAMREHPQWVSGTRRDDTLLMQGVPGLIAKAGAEGVYAVALPDGRAAALKIEDGSQRPRPVVMAALLHALGVEADIVRQQATTPVLGHGEPVGVVRAARELLEAARR
ncbi:MAG: asparaginase [Actinomycetes bacterium]